MLASAAQAAPAAPAAGYRLYVSNEGSGDIAIVDPVSSETVERIALGKRPRGLAASPDGRYLYVALSGSPAGGPGVDEASLPAPDKGADGIAVVEIATRRLLRVMRGVSDPEQVAVSPDGLRLYVASEDSGRLVTIDAATGEIAAQFDVGGEPEGVAVSPDGKTVLATSEEDDAVAIVTPGSARIAGRLPVGKRPRNAAFLAGGRLALVPGELDASLTLIDVERRKVLRRVHIPGAMVLPMGIRIAGGAVFVTTGRGGELVKLDAATLAMKGRVRVGERPWGLAVSADGQFAFTANGPSNTMTIVRTADMRVVGAVKVGERPWGVVAVPVR